MLRPGKFTITDKGIEIAKLPKDAKVLEIGCGEGETTERLEKEYGFEVSPIDTSLEMLRLTNERGLKANAVLGDGEFLENFTSRTFDGVISECVLSLIGKPDEAIHEAYCTLKNGGKYIISDLYYKVEDKALKIKTKKKAEIAATTEAPYNACNDECHEAHETRDVDFRADNIFYKDELIKALEETGFEDIKFEDYTGELESYMAETIMSGKENPYKVCIEGKKGVGYFLIVAKKPE